MTRHVANLFAKLPDAHAAEVVETLAATGSIRIERIVSHGQSSPDGSWYDQELDEWVILLRGGATLRFEGSEDPIALGPGDFVDIPAHVRHRVEWDRTGPGYGLAGVHYRR